MSDRRKKYLCPEHHRQAMCMKYDSWCCPVCLKWTEPECECSAEDYEAEECHVPKPRPANADGLTLEIYD